MGTLKEWWSAHMEKSKTAEQNRLTHQREMEMKHGYKPKPSRVPGGTARVLSTGMICLTAILVMLLLLVALVLVAFAVIDPGEWIDALRALAELDQDYRWNLFRR